MSLKKSTKDRIKKYILEKIEINDVEFKKKAAESFGVSLTSVYRYVKELSEEGLIRRNGKKYVLNEKRDFRVYDTDNTLEEDRIYDELIKAKVAMLPDNVRKIWQYAFTEMMNNAIEHSNAEKIEVCIVSNCNSTKVMIEDDGVGIFEKIKDYCGYENLDDAVNELFKGKLTTDSENHTGEGIFFTSRMIENFGVLSSGKIFTHNPHLDAAVDICTVPELKSMKDQKGTIVVMIMPNDSRANIKEVFDMFSDVDSGFTKTSIPLRKIFTDGFPVSRSQAKRLSARFEEFEEVILDFEGIDDVGQGFAHELFVVFQRRHPDVNLIIVNENRDVKRMILHVTAKDN